MPKISTTKNDVKWSRFEEYPFECVAVANFLNRAHQRNPIEWVRVYVSVRAIDRAYPRVHFQWYPHCDNSRRLQYNNKKMFIWMCCWCKWLLRLCFGRYWPTDAASRKTDSRALNTSYLILVFVIPLIIFPPFCCLNSLPKSGATARSDWMAPSGVHVCVHARARARTSLLSCPFNKWRLAIIYGNRRTIMQWKIIFDFSVWKKERGNCGSAPLPMRVDEPCVSACLHVMQPHVYQPLGLLSGKMKSMNWLQWHIAKRIGLFFFSFIPCCCCCVHFTRPFSVC